MKAKSFGNNPPTKKNLNQTITGTSGRLRQLNGWGFIAALLLLILAAAVPTLAQNEQGGPPTLLKNEAPTLRFEHLGLNDGLAQSSVYAMIQDSAGFIWIGTQAGVQRYDGHNLKLYASTPYDTTSLSSSFVLDLAEASNGDLWVATDNGGLNRLDPATGHAVHYRHNPQDSTSLASDGVGRVLQASNGDVWIVTGKGLDRMRAGDPGRFTHYRHEEGNSTTLTSDILISLSEDAKGTIWAGSANGLNRIDPQTGAVRRYLYNPEASQNDIFPGGVYKPYLSVKTPGIAWLPTSNGLVRLNTETGTHERFPVAPNKNGLNPRNRLYEVVSDPDDPAILWATGSAAGLVRFDTRSQTFTSYRHDPQDPHSLSDNHGLSLLAGRDGMMWAGTQDGLNAFNPGAVNFTHLRPDPDDPESLAPGLVWGLYEDRAGTLWAGTQPSRDVSYLTRIDPAGRIRRYQNRPGDPHSIQAGYPLTFAEDSLGHVWMGHAPPGGGLSRINRATGRITQFGHKRTPENRWRNAINVLLPTTDNPNVLWVGSYAGLDRFDTRTGHFSRTPLHSTVDDKELIVVSLYQNADRTLWAGTNKGLIRLEPATGKTQTFTYNAADTTTINNNVIIDITARTGKPSVLWLATLSGGLNRFDTLTGTATHYTAKDGLPNNAVYGILEDKSGTLWMSTNNGISNFDPKTKAFRNYGLDDGLMALEYDQNAFAKGKNGTFYFGSAKGITAFKPEDLHINKIPPQVAFTGLKLSNKTVHPGPDSPLRQPLAETDSLTLAHDQNELTFNFVALHFANPAKNTYSYRLDGFDNDWVEAGTRSEATYTNLPPGDYTFRVKAANADGVWNEKGALVQLTVLPPWWRTWWAYGLFALLLAGMVFGVDRTQRRRISKKERERTALREAELRAEAENKRRADTEQLSKIGRAITSTLSVDKIIETVYENVNALMDAAIFGVGIYNKERNRLDFPATKEKGKMLPPYTHRLDEENRLAVRCFTNKEDIIIADFQQEHKKYLKLYEPPVEGEDAKSILYLPLIQKDHVVGVITTQSFEKNAYTEYHVNLLRNLATYAAIALDNAAAYRQLNATLSELQSMQQQLVQQEKLASLGQLTAGIAHEIKNPLNFVNNFSDVSLELIEEVKEELLGNKKQIPKIRNHKSAVDHAQPPAEGDARIPDGTESGDVINTDYLLSTLEDIEANLHKIYEHGNRADGIVKSMLQHSRGGTGKMEYVNLNVLVKEYVNLAFHGMRAGKHSINVDIELKLDDKVGKVPLVGEDFSRVILNLCNNAFDAMQEKLSSRQQSGDQPSVYEPKLTVRTARKNNHVLVKIEDNGPGIPAEIKDKIMQPFFTTKKGTNGTGLGLSITNDIVKAHGGKIDIMSTEGRSTTFIISLPVKK